MFSSVVAALLAWTRPPSTAASISLCLPVLASQLKLQGALVTLLSSEAYLLSWSKHHETGIDAPSDAFHAEFLPSSLPLGSKIL